MAKKTTPRSQSSAVVLAFRRGRRKDEDHDSWRDTWRTALARAGDENAGPREAVNAVLRSRVPELLDRLQVLPPDMISEADGIVFHPAALLRLFGPRFLLSDLFSRTMVHLYTLARVRGVEKNLSRRMKPAELRALAEKRKEAIRRLAEFRQEDELLQRLKLKPVRRKDGRGVKYPSHTKCPAHHDPGKSLSIRMSADGKFLLKCPNSCTREEIFKAKGLDPKPDERDIETSLRSELEKEFEVDRNDETHLAARRVLEEVFQAMAGPKPRAPKKNREAEITTRVLVHMAEGQSREAAFKAAQAEVGKPHGQAAESAYKRTRQKERMPDETGGG